MHFTAQPTRFLFFTGKGGVGKTSLAAATAIHLADRGKRVLLVSTDPASNLDQVLGVTISSSATTPIPQVQNLHALNIDPESTAAAYRERVLGPLRGQVSEHEIRQREEELSGACTVEIAAFDEFTSLLAGGERLGAYDHIVFDTAPTGHTLRLLSLPAAWSEFIDDNPGGASCLGPPSALLQHQAKSAEAVAALSDPARTTLVLVTRPERGALTEAARTSTELRQLAIDNQHLVINGVFTAANPDDPVAVALEQRGQTALRDLPPPLATLPTSKFPLLPFNLVGIAAIRRLLDNSFETPTAQLSGPPSLSLPDTPSMKDLIDELAKAGHGLILVMGKGGVGKTTIAASIAVGLASRGYPTHLTTTDPAAHVAATIEDEVDNLRVSRIDPAVETRAYTERALAVRGRDLDPAQLELLREDLRSPCTEEVAVFHAFSRIISRARSEFVVIDTAPTGHTLLLLDATGAYHHEVMRSLDRRAGTTSAVTPLMRLRDPEYTKVLIVTLPETTPVLEAAQLQEDLRRAAVEPFGWVVNGSLAAAGTSDPLLQQRAAAELEHIALVRERFARRVFLVPWSAAEPIGPDALATLAGGIGASTANSSSSAITGVPPRITE